jgi:mycofactocin system glycosyltransferase
MGGAGPSAIAHAPDRNALPLPASFGLVMDPATSTADGGAVLMGGAPFRLLRLSPRARTVVDRWNQGAPVGEGRAAQRLARRLVSGGTFLPRPPPIEPATGDVTVVIPVRDRTAQLERLLTALAGLPCVVVDDASRDARRCREVALGAGARFVGLPVNQGPATARNEGLALVTTPLVAFVDSDCLPSADWLDPLRRAFDDPLVAAVAPRIVPAGGPPTTWLGAYESVQSSLDRGPTAGLVRPQSPIPYVPSAALVLRRSVAIGPALFDPRLRGGEDVDLVWRLAEAGWDVRYLPESTVLHQGPATVPSFLSRRAFYGTSAAPLARRHGAVMAPLHASAWTAAVWALLAARRPGWAGAVLATSVLILARRLQGLVGHPLPMAARIAAGGTAKSTLPALSGLARAWSPALVLAFWSRRARRPAAMALLVPAVAAWGRDSGGLDPVRFATAHVADDLAYGAGVWAGCWRERTVRPLVPRISWRARVWSSPTLRAALGPRATTPRGD